MPTYVYGSKQLKHKWEISQSIKDQAFTHLIVDTEGNPLSWLYSAPPTEVTPPAKLIPIERVIVSSGFILRGDGWAKDGYSSSGQQ